MLESLIETVGAMNPAWFYSVLFLCAYIENVFPPVPGDTVTVFAAYIVGRTQQNFLGAFVSTTLGSVAGFMTLYLLGRLVPPGFFVERDYRFFPAAAFRKAGDWFQRYGSWVVLGNRFLSGIRSMISVVAGVYRLHWLRVLALATLSCAAWNGLLLWAGYELGANWRAIEEILRQYSRAVAAVLILAGGAWITRKRLKKE